MSTTARVTIEQVAPKIAAALTAHTAGQPLGPWTAAPSDKYYDNPHEVWYVRRADGTALRMLLAEYTGGRLIISGEVPDAPEDVSVSRDGLQHGRATADPSRPTRAIVQQIIRSVLPVLAESMARFQERVAEARRRDAAVKEVRGQVATVPGFETGLYWKGAPRGTHRYAAIPSASVEIRSDREGAYVHMALDGLPVDQAVRVLRALTAPTA